MGGTGNRELKLLGKSGFVLFLNTVESYVITTLRLAGASSENLYDVDATTKTHMKDPEQPLF